MKTSPVLTPIAEGFKDSIHLTIRIFVAVGAALIEVTSSFVNRTRGNSKPGQKAHLNTAPH